MSCMRAIFACFLVTVAHAEVKIDLHDLATKVEHAIDFLTEDMKVKVTLKFRGREMAHTEVGFQVVERFLSEISGFGHPDFRPKLNGRAINLMISPLPRNKRAKHPQHGENSAAAPPAKVESNHQAVPVVRPARNAETKPEDGFAYSPFAQLETNQG